MQQKVQTIGHSASSLISLYLSLSLFASLFRHRSGTYQRVINDEAKSCRCRAKRYSRGYNPVNFRAGTALPPVQWQARKPVVRCFAHSVRRDVFPGINCCFGVCLRPNYAAATQWDKPEILPLHREKLCDQRGCNAGSSTVQSGWHGSQFYWITSPPPPSLCRLISITPDVAAAIITRDY